MDPVPLIILKGCFGTLLPIITQIVNVSLSTGVMSEALKLAALNPTLKKFGADHEEYPNFRPISNLPMISKVVEKAATEQLTHHVVTNSLDESLQSAYKKFHSTETALVRVQSDTLCAIDNRQSVMLHLIPLTTLFYSRDFL